MIDLSGIWVAIVTPFTHHDHPPGVDHAALRRLVDHLRKAGVKGIVALGSTGEAAALDDAEQDAVLRTVLAAAQGLPIIAGLSGNHVGQLHARLQALQALPLAAVLSSAPAYVRPSQAALVRHFNELADRSAHPLVLYDIPYRTGVAMETETLLALAAHPRIIGIKDCGGSLDKTQQLIADGRLQVLAGEDAQAFHNLCLGGAGVISAAAQVVPEAFTAMAKALRQGDVTTARRHHHALAPLLRALYAEPNPAVVKAVLSRQGWCDTTTRAPMEAATPAAAEAGWQAWLRCQHALRASQVVEAI